MASAVVTPVDSKCYAMHPSPITNDRVTVFHLKNPRYEHQSEKILREILKYYGFDAVYEPHVINMNGLELVPDFLVDGQYYLELTTGKCCCRGRKNKKMQLAVAEDVPLYTITKTLYRNLLKRYLEDKKTGNRSINLARFMKRPGEGETSDFYLSRGLLIPEKIPPSIN